MSRVRIIRGKGGSQRKIKKEKQKKELGKN
jgi:hypothetical protein